MSFPLLLQDRSLSIIGSFVILVHCLLMTGVYYWRQEIWTPQFGPTKKITVQTVTLHPATDPTPLAITETVQTIDLAIKDQAEQNTLTAYANKEESNISNELDQEKTVVNRALFPDLSKLPELEVKINSPSSFPREELSSPPASDLLKSDIKPPSTPLSKPKAVPQKLEPPKPKNLDIKKEQAVGQKKLPAKQKTLKPDDVKKKVLTISTPVKKSEAKPNAHQAAKEKSDFQAEASKKKEAEAIALKAKQQRLLSQIQETIGKIDQSRGKIPLNQSMDVSGVVPHAIHNLQIDAMPLENGQKLNAREISYRDELAGRLKLLLKLPEYGEVKVKLTLERSGKVVKIAVVETESAANQKYIEKTLPGLLFPAFGKNFDQVAQFTFSITLSNHL